MLHNNRTAFIFVLCKKLGEPEPENLLSGKEIQTSSRGSLGVDIILSPTVTTPRKQQDVRVPYVQ